MKASITSDFYELPAYNSGNRALGCVPDEIDTINSEYNSQINLYISCGIEQEAVNAKIIPVASNQEKGLY